MVENFNLNNNILKITDSAAQHFKKYLKKNNDCIGIYIGIKFFGCSGLSYDINFVKNEPKDTRKIYKKDIIFFISNKHINILNGLKIDYVQYSFGLYKLEYTNSNELARCGCGESFTI